MNKIVKILITGSPLAGKDISIDRLRQDLEKAGYYVVNTNEIAERILLNNIKPYGDASISVYDFQNAIFKTQLFLEDLYLSLIEKITTDKTIIFLINRGILDGMPFMKEGEFESIMKENNYDIRSTSNRYDLIFCLESLAMLGIYDKHANNEVRFQEKNEVIEMNNKFYKYYKTYCNNVHYIKATDNFEDKYLNMFNIVNNELKR